MPTPEELQAEKEAQEKAKAEKEAAEKEAAEKLAAEKKAEEDKRILEEAEKKVAEEKRQQEIDAQAKAAAEKLVKETLEKQKHDQDVERATRELRSLEEFGKGDKAKLQESVELANRGLKLFDPSGKTLEVLKSKGLENDPDVLRMLIEVGKAAANDSLRVPGSQPPPPKEKISARERLAQGK